MAAFKPTLKEPTPQGKDFEKNFKKTTLQQGAPPLIETDSMLSEVEQSLKKKIFSLAKMEALVFSDPKLSAIYEDMAQNGEEKYGYHYNETIQNMIFNDYVLNSPKYLQKYKMAIPKEKKRRDKSGINQLKKAGQEKIDATGTKLEKPKDMNEADNEKTMVAFLVHPEHSDVYAYFPEEDYDAEGKYKTGYAHLGQHGAVSPDYASESREATPEEYKDLQAELEGVGYNLEVLNGMSEMTGAGGAGGAGAFGGSGQYSQALGYQKNVDETTGSASSGAFYGPAMWGSGDLMKSKGKSKVKTVPMVKGGTIIGEGKNYLVNPVDFAKYFQTLNEESDANYILNKSDAYGSVDNMSPENQRVIKGDIQKGRWDSANLDGGIALQEKAKSVAQQQLFGMARAAQKGEMPMSKLGGAAKKIAKTVSVDDVEDFAKTKHKGLPDHVDENLGQPDIEYLVKAFEIVNSGPHYDPAKAETFKNNISQMDDAQAQQIYRRFEGMLRKMGYTNLRDVMNFQSKFAVSENEEVGSQVFNKGDKVFDKLHQSYGTVLDNYGDPVNGDGGDIRLDSDGNVPIHQYDKNWNIIGYNLTKVENNNIKETELTMIEPNNSSMSNKAQPTGDSSTETPMGMQSTGGMNELFDNRKEYIITYKDNSGKTSTMNISGLDKESAIKNSGISKSKIINVARDASDLHESDMKILEEINNELNAFSIHHDKLKRMAEERKPSALVLRDRVGSENEKNFKSDLKDSSVSKLVDVENSLEWEDQQSDVGKDPQKLGQDIEKNALKTGDMKSGEALKNVGNSANDDGDEIPKRNLSDEEQDEVNLYRLGLGDLVYDNEVGERFEDRMKADMGDKLYKQRQDKLEFRGKAPMYNKDPQPIEDTTSDKVQFNKEQTGWNERMGLKETVITGKYLDQIGKKRILTFNLNEVWELKSNKAAEYLVEMNLEGMGNTYTQKVNVNESVVKAMNEFKFYTNGVEAFVLKNPVKSLNENAKAEKPVVNEQMEKMKHLLGYKPETFVNTDNSKKNRGF